MIDIEQLRSADIGSVAVPKVRGNGFSEDLHKAFISEGYLKMDGSIISGKDYPELYGALASRGQWIDKDKVRLPNMAGFDYGSGVGYIKAKKK